MKGDDFFTTGEVAALCGVTLRTVINWINKDYLISHKLPGTRGDNRIPKESLVSFMLKNGMPLPKELLISDKNTTVDNNLVLVVDDDIGMAKSIARILRQLGKNTLIANNGFEAGVLYAEKHPFLMTLDIQMPKIDGFSVLQSLRQRKIGKILVISAVDKSLQDRAFSYGADEFLEKPFHIDDLRRIIKKIESYQL